MWLQILVATGMVTLTVLLHAIGLSLLGRFIKIEEDEENHGHVAPTSFQAIGFTTLLVLGLIVLHAAEIWGYALLYVGLGAIADIETAIYYSTISYSTVGFNDDTISPSWRLVGAIESINGVILIGWSTAFFVTVIRGLGRH